MLVVAVFMGGNNQPPCRTNNPHHYGYYDFGAVLIDPTTGVIDVEVWLDHMASGWAARYRIPLQGGITLTDALYEMFSDAGWRATRTLPSGRIVFWVPVSSLEWVHTTAVPVTDTVSVGHPVFIGMY